MKDIWSIADDYISENLLGWFTARRKRPLPKVHMTYKKPRMKLYLVLDDEAKETLAFFLGVVLLGALFSLALSPYLDTLLSWI